MKAGRAGSSLPTVTTGEEGTTEAWMSGEGLVSKESVEDEWVREGSDDDLKGI